MDRPSETPSGARRISAAVGLVLVLSYLLFLAWPPALAARGFPWTAAAVGLAAAGPIAFLIMLAAVPDTLQRPLSRFTGIDLRDNGHVIAAVVMLLTLFFVVGAGASASGVFALESRFVPPADLMPPPTVAATGTPTAPAINGTFVAGNVTLTWNVTDANTTHYSIYRGRDAAFVSFVTNTTNTTYVDQGLTGGSAWVYRVTASNSAGESLPSTAASIIVPVPSDLLFAGVMENVILLTLPAFFYVAFIHHKGPAEAIRALGLKSEGIGKALAVGALSAVAFIILFGLAVATYNQFETIPDNERAIAIGLGVGVLGAVGLALGSGISEEIFFRGFLQPRIGMWGQAIVFAIAHVNYVNVLEIIVVFLLALIFGYMFRRTGNLWGPIAAHVTFNLINLLFVVCSNDPAACTLGA